MKLSPGEFPEQISADELRALKRLLAQTDIDFQQPSFMGLRGDGSERRFIRIREKAFSLVAILPNLAIRKGRSEARSTWLIGRHLYERGVPVPELYGFDPDTGVVLCEDLGDLLFQQEVVNKLPGEKEIMNLYSQAVSVLVLMQVEGARGFDSAYCWDTGRYDRRLMLDRESGYFFDSCCRGMLGIDKLPAGLKKDFRQLAELAAAGGTDYFLHRDYQSRNLIVKDGRLRVLDFQGGRLGPLGYDLASLLYDPYVVLDKTERGRLFGNYLEALPAYEISIDMIADSYYWLALQRNLQIIGAFASLGNEKGKPFFLKYLQPAAVSLAELLEEPGGARLPFLRALSVDLPARIEAALATFHDV